MIINIIQENATTQMIMMVAIIEITQIIKRFTIQINQKIEIIKIIGEIQDKSENCDNQGNCDKLI